MTLASDILDLFNESISRDYLTNDQWLALSIYLGFKSTHRRSEMARHNIDYDQAVKELTDKNFIIKGKLRKDARQLWNSVFPNITTPSQTHMVKAELDK